MKDSDFEALLAGLPPTEVRRVQEILNEWARGDENGFPVQLALLTRAQWEAAAMPSMLERKVGYAIGQLRNTATQLTEVADDLKRTLQAERLLLRHEVTQNSRQLETAAKGVREQVRSMEVVAPMIRKQLEESAACHASARDALKEAARALNDHACDHLAARQFLVYSALLNLAGIALHAGILVFLYFRGGH